MIEYIEKEIKSISTNTTVTDHIKKELKEDDKELKFELLALRFMLEEGKVKPVFTMGDYSHPTFEQLGEEGIEYVKSRAENVNVTNNYLIARYNQIAYNHPETKHNKYLDNSINAYLKIIAELTSKKNNERDYDLQVALYNFIHLGAESKNNHTIIKDEFKRLMHLKTLPARIKMNLIETAVEVKSVFKPADLKMYIPLWDTIYKGVKKNGDNSWVRYFAETGLNLAKRTQTDVKPWYSEIGDTYRIDTLKEAPNDDRIMVAVIHCDSAIRAYKSAGNDVKLEEMRVLRVDLKDRFKLPVHHFEIEIEKDVIFERSKTTRKLLDSLFAMESNDMYSSLSVGHGLFPSADDMANQAKDRSSFLDMISTAYFDTNNNKASDASSKEEKKIKKFYESYNYLLGFAIIPMLNEIFYQGVVRDKITFENFTKFLKEDTWMGKVPIRKGGTSSWVQMIAFAMNEYFTQMERMLIYPDYNYIPVVLLDSLTTKFEGAFRQLCGLKGIIITTETKEGQREKFLHELIYDDEVLKIFGKDDIIFFRYLYTSNGLDLRNRIAHSFMVMEDYGLSAVHLVIMSFLRLGRYDLKQKKKITT